MGRHPNVKGNAPISLRVKVIAVCVACLFLFAVWTNVSYFFALVRHHDASTSGAGAEVRHLFTVPPKTTPTEASDSSSGSSDQVQGDGGGSSSSSSSNSEERSAAPKVDGSSITVPAAPSTSQAQTQAPTFSEQYQQTSPPLTEAQAVESPQPSQTAPSPPSPPSEAPLPKDNTNDRQEDPFDPHINHITFFGALDLYSRNLLINVSAAGQDPKQATKSFIDVSEIPEDGILLPHDPTQVPQPQMYEACDANNAEFTAERDRLCQEYLLNINNIRSIKPLASLLYSGRTLKFKAFYRHHNIKAVVKVSQNKFFYEAASEYLSYAVDRGLNFSYVPTTAFVRLPVDYMKAAASVVSPFFTQWFDLFVPNYDYTRGNFVTCDAESPYTELLNTPDLTPDPKELPFLRQKYPEAYKVSVPEVSQRQNSHHQKGGAGTIALHGKCSLVAVQLWMNDVHSALDSFLAVPHDYSEHFARKFLRPHDDDRRVPVDYNVIVNGTSAPKHKHYEWPPSKPHRLQALGDLCDRFIFDFLIGNTDRGMNDHNNFVYGGCTDRTECAPPPEEQRTKGPPKYAFIDHGSSFYSHKEPEGSPFTGNATLICRFRRRTYDRLRYFDRENTERGSSYQATLQEHVSRPFITFVRSTLPKNIFNVIHLSVFKMVQDRLQKIVKHVDHCVETFGSENVFSL